MTSVRRASAQVRRGRAPSARVAASAWLIRAALLIATSALPATVRADEPARDYDAADPRRTPLTFLHAAADAAATDYLVYQLDWTRDDPTYRVTRRTIA